MKAYGEWTYRSTRFLALGTSLRRVVSFTPGPVYLLGNNVWLGEPQRRSGRYGEETILGPA
jgi:hypothetical protein